MQNCLGSRAGVIAMGNRSLTVQISFCIIANRSLTTQTLVLMAVNRSLTAQTSSFVMSNWSFTRPRTKYQDPRTKGQEPRGPFKWNRTTFWESCPRIFHLYGQFNFLSYVKNYTFFNDIFCEPNPVPIKFLMHLKGLLSSPDVRLPLCPPSSSNKSLLEKIAHTK